MTMARGISASKEADIWKVSRVVWVDRIQQIDDRGTALIKRDETGKPMVIANGD